jgi:hypothetical protein
MYSKITNPDTGRTVKIDSKLGRKIIARYQTQLLGGSHQPNQLVGHVGQKVETVNTLRHRTTSGCRTIKQREYCKDPCKWSHMGDVKGYCRGPNDSYGIGQVRVFRRRPPAEMLTDFSQIWTIWRHANLTDIGTMRRTYDPSITSMSTRAYSMITYTLKWGKYLGPGIFFLVIWGMTSYYSAIIDVINELFPLPTSRRGIRLTDANLWTEWSRWLSSSVSGKITDSVIGVYNQLFGDDSLIFGVDPGLWFRRTVWSPIDEELQWGAINHIAFDLIFIKILDRITPSYLDFHDSDSKCREIAFIIFSLLLNAPYFANLHIWHSSKYISRITMDTIYRKYGIAGSSIYHSLWNMFSTLVFNDQVNNQPVSHTNIALVSTGISLVGTGSFIHQALRDNPTYLRAITRSRQTFYDKVDFVIRKIHGTTVHEHQD